MAAVRVQSQCLSYLNKWRGEGVPIYLLTIIVKTTIWNCAAEGGEVGLNFLVISRFF